MDTFNRLTKLREQMEGNGFDVAVYGTGANFQYFTDIHIPWKRLEEPREPRDFLIVNLDKEPLVIFDKSNEHLAKQSCYPTIISSSLEETESILRGALNQGKTDVNVQARPYLHQLINPVDYKPENSDGASDLGEILRVIKDENEIELLRTAASLAGKTLTKLIPHIKRGVSQIELEAKLAQIGKTLGADDISFKPTVGFVKSSTAPSNEPFVYPGTEGLVPLTSIAFDYGFLVQGYCSDFGRSFYFGTTPKEFANAYKALHVAMQDLVGRIRPNVTKVGNMFGMLEKTMDQLGFGDRLRARLGNGTLGHQIGLDVHEEPWIRPGVNSVLRPGMVMAIEPKVWLPGEYYFRVEDIVLITESGAEFLTEFDREMFEL